MWSALIVSLHQGNKEKISKDVSHEQAKLIIQSFGITVDQITEHEKEKNLAKNHALWDTAREIAKSVALAPNI
jgi:hypothetical protein